MSTRAKKLVLSLVALLLLASGSQVQTWLNRAREELGLTRVQPLDNAPPVLAFTTVALGGFRGLISNILWIRANDLQEDDKYFEMAQLADWITKLEPHFVQVWLVQSWNMAYNISVKFKDYPDRWRWVRQGIELLRDDGLRYNPNETLIYRELAWFFQHKMGQNLDDANIYYKQAWANEMARVFGKLKRPNLEELIHPQTDDQRERRRLLIEVYKMDPEFMQKIDQEFGPLEWRLPESSAIYWAALGLKVAEQNPSKIKPDDLITLHRVIYQSMQMSFHRGRLIENPFVRAFEFGPNLEIIPKVSFAYEQAANEDVKNHDHILHAHRNFLKDAVYFLYAHNRIEDAAKWYKYLGEKYPDQPVLDGKTNSLPSRVPLDVFAMEHVQEDVTDTVSNDRIKAIITGLLENAYKSLVLGEDENAAGLTVLADKIRTAYQSKTKSRADSIPMPPLDDLKSEVLNRILDPDDGAPPDFRAALRAKLGKGLEPLAPPPATNAPVKVSAQ